MAPEPLVDHLVIVVPYSFLTAPPTWLTNAFTVSQGGKHADGVTENILVHLPDGSYIEFIAFTPGIDPSKRSNHKWGHKQEGAVADWALTLDPAKSGVGESKDSDIHGATIFHDLQERVKASQAEIEYQDPVKGGRLRPDGAELRWAVSSPLRQDGEQTPIEPGQVPFWCLDRTPRNLRVPFEEPGATDHPSGVLGIARVGVQRVENVQRSSLQAVYHALLGKDQAGEWQISSFVRNGVHPGTRVVVLEGGKAGGIDISFFSKNTDWAGKSIGGKIDDQHSLHFGIIVI